MCCLGSYIVKLSITGHVHSAVSYTVFIEVSTMSSSPSIYLIQPAANNWNLVQIELPISWTHLQVIKLYSIESDTVSLTRDTCLIHMLFYAQSYPSVHNQNTMRVEFSTAWNWIGNIYTVKISLLLVDVSSWLQMVALDIHR